MYSNYLFKKRGGLGLSPAKEKEKKSPYIVIFGVLFFSSGFGISYHIGGTAVLVACLSLAVALTIFCGQCRIDMSLLMIISIYLLCILTTTIYRDDDLKQFIIYFVYIIVALLLSQTRGFDFNKVYVRLLYFLAIFSLVMWVGYVLAPSLIQRLPTISNRYGLKAYSALFSTIYPSGNMLLPRNQGVFWEAGAYQTFLNIAVMIALFSDCVKANRVKYIFVLGLAIATTFSTTGYIVFCSILLSFCLNEIFSAKTANGLIKCVAVLVFAIMAFFAVYSFLPSDARFQIFGKLAHYLEDTEQLTSTAVRVNAMERAFSAFLEAPLFGWGTKYFEMKRDNPYSIMTCTPINFFAYYGSFVGVIANIGMFLYIKSITKNGFLNVSLFACLLISTISENYMRDPIVLTLIMLGYSRSNSEAGKVRDEFGVL